METGHLRRPGFHRTRRRSEVWALALSVLALALTAPGVGAGVGWCPEDPVVAIDGEIGDIIYSVMFDDLPKVNGPTRIVVITPVGVAVKLAIAGAGYGYGEHVSFAESKSLKVTSQGIEVWIKVHVPASVDELPVRVEFAPHVVGVLEPATVEGTTNDWVSLRTLL